MLVNLKILFNSASQLIVLVSTADTFPYKAQLLTFPSVSCSCPAFQSSSPPFSISVAFADSLRISSCIIFSRRSSLVPSHELMTVLDAFITCSLVLLLPKPAHSLRTQLSCDRLCYSWLPSYLVCSLHFKFCVDRDYCSPLSVFSVWQRVDT